MSTPNSYTSPKDPDYGLEYEEIRKGDYSATFRMKVHGGWIIKEEFYFGDNGLSITFLPDPNHEWTLQPQGQDEDNA